MIATLDEKQRMETLYNKYLSEGFQTCTGLVRENGNWVDGHEYWSRLVKGEFGEDSEITKELLKERTEFISGK